MIVDGVRPDDRLFPEETFGPIVGVTTFRTLDEAIELANLPGYGLSVLDLHHRPEGGVPVPRAASARAWSA